MKTNVLYFGDNVNSQKSIFMFFERYILERLYISV